MNAFETLTLRADRPPADRARADDARTRSPGSTAITRASQSTLDAARRRRHARLARGRHQAAPWLDPDRAQQPDGTRTTPHGGHPWRLLALLIGVTAIGPLSLNILVPAMPGLIVTLGAGAGTVQLTLSLFLLGMAVSQLVLGPLSDRFGRRPVMLAGLALTVVASFAALAATSIAGLIVARTAAGVRRDRRHRDRPRDHPRPLRPRPRRLDDRLGHHGDGDRADDRAADRRRARHRVRLAGDLRVHRRCSPPPCSSGRRSQLPETRAVATGEGFGALPRGDAASLLARPHVPRLRAGRRDQFGDVLHLHRRRAACRRHHHGAHARPNTASGSSSSRSATWWAISPPGAGRRDTASTP